MLYSISRNTDLLRNIVFVSCILLPYTQSAPTSAAAWWNNLIPRNQENPTIAEELKCYSLPFGFLGFLSHILTHWTVACNTLGRSPCWPPRKLTSGRFDIALGLSQILVTTVAAIITMARCHDRWEISLLAFWKLVMGVAAGTMALTGAYCSMQEERTRYGDDGGLHEFAIKLMMFFYGLALILGLAGTLHLVVEHIHEQHGLRWVCGVFGAVIGTIVVLSLCGGEIPLLVYGTPAMLALFSDWVLAVLADNYLGAPIPGEEKVLFWVSHFKNR